MSRGYIPTQIHFFLREPEALTNRDREGIESAIPAFPVSNVSIERGHQVVENAKMWAVGASRWINPDPNKIPTYRVMDNVSKSGYWLIGAEQRSSGGRAWRVISPEGFLVDMREDVFLPILLKKGLPPSGLIDAEFQWCQNGSQLRLEEVGSKQHSEYTLLEK